MKGKFRSTAILSGLLLLSLLFGCSRVDAPTQLEAQKATVLSATFTEPVIKADIQGWTEGTYYTDFPEIMAAEAISRRDGTKRRLVVEIIGFKLRPGTIEASLTVPMTVTIRRPSTNTVLGQWTIDTVGCDHGAPCAAGMDVRSGLPVFRAGDTVRIVQRQTDPVTNTTSNVLIAAGVF
jgi:hypothetical protein